MSLWKDEKYLRLLSGQLERFKQLSPQHYNCRCPFCGDSAQSKIKARGYFFPAPDTLLFKCFNCSISLPFGAVIQRLSRPLYDEYMMEDYRERLTPKEPPIVAPKASRALVVYENVHQLSASELPEDILPVLTYVRNRHLPSSALSCLYGTTHAHTFLAPLVGEKAERVKDGLPYLVIPLRLTNGEWYGAQFRLLTRKEYITFRWNHESLRVFGLNTVDSTQQVYLTESPLDSLCIKNGIAACGSDLLGALQTLLRNKIVFPNVVLVWDNEPRSKEITKMIETAIQQSHKVVIWKRELPKDLNEMYEKHYDIESLIERYTYQGLRAELEFKQWAR